MLRPITCKHPVKLPPLVKASSSPRVCILQSIWPQGAQALRGQARMPPSPVAHFVPLPPSQGTVS